MLKIALKIFVLLFLMTSGLSAQTKDSLAKNDSLSKGQLIFKKHLAYLDTLTNKNLWEGDHITFDSDSIKTAVNLMESVTNISSTAEYTYAGRIFIPRKDYKKWKAWFDTNKDKLRWNQEKQKIEVQEN